jgi:hypothetical protein
MVFRFTFTPEIVRLTAEYRQSFFARTTEKQYEKQ